MNQQEPRRPSKADAMRQKRLATARKKRKQRQLILSAAAVLIVLILVAAACVLFVFLRRDDKNAPAPDDPQQTTASVSDDAQTTSPTQQRIRKVQHFLKQRRPHPPRTQQAPPLHLKRPVIPCNLPSLPIRREGKLPVLPRLTPILY